MLRRAAPASLCAVALFLLPALSWADSSTEPAQPPEHAISAEFFVEGTNGYLLEVNREGQRVGILARKPGPPMAGFAPGEGNLSPPGNNFSASGGSFSADEGNFAANVYTVSATPGSDPASSIDADLGSLGRISVVFVPSGAVRVRKFSKKDKTKHCNAPSRIVRRLGTFSGTIAFAGEGGYTTVDVTSAKGSVGTSPRRSCTTKVSRRSSERPDQVSAPPMGAFLGATDSAGAVSFMASTHRPGSAARFFAQTFERVGEVSVFRIAAARGRAGSFSFDGERDSATVSPPPPFSGQAVYRDDGTSAPSWTGSLSVAFPGVATPLAGPPFKAKLLASG